MRKRLLSALSAGLLLTLCACAPGENAQTPAPTTTASTPPTAEVSSTPAPVPMFISNSTQKLYSGEDPLLNGPYPGISVSFRLDMPHIENATEHPGWDQINTYLSAMGAEWLQKGLEYVGTPGLTPDGNYWVEGTYTVERIDTVISLRHPRTERLTAHVPARTVSAEVFDADTGALLELGDFFRIADQENNRVLTRRLAEEAAALGLGPYDAAELEGLLGYNAFYFTGDSLVLLFPVWAGDATSPTSTLELPIPLVRLSDICNEKIPPAISASFPALASDYPPELQDLLPSAIGDDIAGLQKDYGIRCTGSELTGAKKLCRVYINEGHAELWQIDYVLTPSSGDNLELLPRSLDSNGTIPGNRLAVVGTDPSGSYSSYCGSLPRENISDLTDETLCEKAVLELCWSITDLEFSLTRDGFPAYCGLGGSGIHFMAPYEGSTHAEETLTWDVPAPGESWQRDTWKGLTAVCLISPGENRRCLYSIDTTLPDVTTYRGIRLGATYEDVIEAYPELIPETRSTNGGDHLVYVSTPSQPFGSFLHFYFGADGTVSRILMEQVAGSP